MRSEEGNADSADELRRGVVAVLCRNSRLLVIRRAESVAAPGAYCFPGGAIEAGESEPQALRRELMEELNADVVPRERLWESVTSWSVALSWWRADFQHSAPLVPNPDEVASFHWLTVAEMRALPELLPSNRQFLDALSEGVFSIDGMAPG